MRAYGSSSCTRQAITRLALAALTLGYGVGCGDSAEVWVPGDPPPNAGAGGSSGEGMGGRPPGSAGQGATSPGGSDGLPGAGQGGTDLGGSPATGGSAGTGVELPVDAAAAWVFDDAELHTYELTLDPGVWAALQLDALDEQYAEASLSAGDIQLGRVALRFKGSLGSLVGCFADDGTRICSKLGMKLKFDEYLPEQRFLGLKRLNFNAEYWDSSLMRERVAYRVFREMALVAPRAAHARLVINGEYQGVFDVVEEVDGRFTHDHFAEGNRNGNLYKEQWPNTDDPVVLGTRLETNEDVADHSLLLQFHADLARAAQSDLPQAVARYMDVDSLLGYLAVDTHIIDWDGMATFYCNDEDCENHNYYLYQHETEPRFDLIPWDLDNTFSLDSPLAGVPGVFDMPTDCSLRYPASGRMLMAPACDPLLHGLVQSDGARYVAQLERLIEGPLAPGRIESWIDTWQAQIEGAVAEDTQGPSVDEFHGEIDRVKNVLPMLRDRISADRAHH